MYWIAQWLWIDFTLCLVGVTLHVLLILNVYKVLKDNLLDTCWCKVCFCPRNLPHLTYSPTLHLLLVNEPEQQLIDQYNTCTAYIFCLVSSCTIQNICHNPSPKSKVQSRKDLEWLYSAVSKFFSGLWHSRVQL